MGRTRWLLRAATLLALVGCSRPPSFIDGLHEDVAGHLTLCQRLEGDKRDWCALQALQMSPAGGKDKLVACDRMRARLAVDRCVDQVARTETDPIDGETCDEIHSRRFRESCRLTTARRQLSGTLDEAVQACARTGRLVPVCTSELVRVRALTLRDDPDRLTEEVRSLLELHPQLAYDTDFAEAVGLSSREIGVLSGTSGPCDAFPPGNGGLTCVHSLSY